MSDLRSEIVSKVLNSWDNGITATPPQVEAQEQSISRKVFYFVNNNPSCTVNDIVAGVGIDLGRASATTLALYQRGKLDRKPYPNPDPNGKRGNVFVYWTSVSNYTDATFKRMMKPKKQKKVVITENKPTYQMPRMEQVARPPRRMETAFNPEALIQDLSLREAKQLFETLKGYFGG
jgi:hypothetical protein